MQIGAIFFDLGDVLVDTSRKWMPGAKALLDSLDGLNVRTGLISNTGNFTRAQLLEQLLPPGFSFDRFDPDLILLSSELSEQDLAKPNIRIFLRAMSQAAIKATALNPNTLLFVGEDQHEVLSAQRAGLIGMRINGSGNEGTLQTMLTDLNEAGFSL